MRLGGLHTGAPIAEVATASLGIIRSDPRLRSDISTSEIPDLDSVDQTKWQKYWLKFPLTHLTNSNTSLYRLDGDWIKPTFRIAEHEAEKFVAMAAEIIDWRLLRYLTEDIIKKVPGQMVLRLGCHPGGRPLIRLDRKKHEQTPKGLVDFSANGKIYIGNFVKIALNVAAFPDEDRNVLPDLLRYWFGPEAGHPGTKHHVVLTQNENGWALRPLEEPRAQTA
jgi:hypothetical protein